VHHVASRVKQRHEPAGRSSVTNERQTRSICAPAYVTRRQCL
jgi:hypothetical protein